MRVLHINSGNMYGGVETFLATLAREAAAAPGMDSEFALCFEGRLSAELVSVGSAVHQLGAVRLSRPHTVLRARRALRALLERGTYDVVVCHQPWSCVVFGPTVRAAGFPLVLWVHMAGNGRHWLERLASLTRPDLAICNSKFSASALSRWLRRAEIEHLYCPVSFAGLADSSTRTQVRAELRTSEGDVVFLQVSRLEEWKGQRALLTALSRLRDARGWTCWIVGGAERSTEAAYLRDLQSLARREGIEDRVRFVGERRDVPRVLSAADVFCQPNVSPEPFGLALVEALHAGLPVVTSGIGGACEIVDGSCGILTPPGNAVALADAIGVLLVDGHLRARLGAAARRRPDEICNAPRQMRRIQTVLGAVVRPPLTTAPCSKGT